MPTSLFDLIDATEFQHMLNERYIVRREHPILPLSILNYSDSAQYDHQWNHATRTCRGLIVHRDTLEVVARPWAKFFNYGQPDAAQIDLTDAVEVTDKMDGSLGILYPAGEGQFAVATRGSFISDQAQHATELYRQKYADRFTPPAGWTFLVEIVYPDNRIVLDYDGLDDLVLLGAVNIESGETVGPEDEVTSTWPGPRTEVFTYATLADALAAEPRKNAEGLVVRRGSDLLKIKQADYVALHKLVTGLNARAVWERLGDGESVAGICEALPDEFHTWVRETAGGLLAQQGQLLRDTLAGHDAILSALGDDWTRKDYAAKAAQVPTLRPWLFNVLDGKDPSASIWKTLRPGVDNSLLHITEDVA